MRVAAGLLAAVIALPAAAQQPLETAKRLVAAALADPWAYEFVAGLTTEIGPRLAGTEAERRAAEWSATKLKAAGFDEVRIESLPMTAWLRGTETASVTAPAPQALAVTALGGSVSTPPEGIESEIALFRSYGELLAAPPGSLAGKIAVVTQRQVRFMDGTGYGAAGPVRRGGASEAAKRGAVAYLHRSLGTADHRLPHTGAMGYLEGVPRIPAAALSNPDADQLERLAARGPVRVKVSLTTSTVENAQAHTVVAEIKGRETPDEIVLIGAHLDSWDLGTGAIDDGAGCAIVAGAARLIAALPQRPKRTVRVVLFGAEEMDYSGPAYAAAHGSEAGKIVIAGESDFGARKVVQMQLPQNAMASMFGRGVAVATAPLGIVMNPAPATMGGADIRPLQRLGVPVMSLRQNGIDYFDVHHTANDTLDKIDPAELAQAVAAWAATAYLAAETGVDFRALARER
jgi:Zn-dependent M28 family amino/carboxypeptidase